MMLKSSLLFLLFVAWLPTAFCQHNAQRDSVVKAARAEARNFRLDDATWKKYRHKLPYTSDYFKPQATDLKNTVLLRDSAFLDAYRHAAYKRNKHRHTPWHYVLVGGTTVAGISVLLLTAFLIYVAPTLN